MNYRNSWILILVIAAFSCKSNKESKGNIFSNDMEQYAVWSGTGTIVNKAGHSGNYCSQLDSSYEYSLTFQSTLKEMASTQPKKVKFSAWCKVEKLPSNISLVCSIEKPGKKISWTGIPAKDFLTVAGQWLQIKGEVGLPATVPLDAVVKVYVWNSGKEKALVDDFEIECL